MNRKHRINRDRVNGVMYSELKDRKAFGPRQEAEAEIDRRLALMCALRPPNRTYNKHEISMFVGGSHAWCYAVEQRALKKLRTAVSSCIRFRDAGVGLQDLIRGGA